MSFIKSRKKLVSSAIASSLSVIAVPAIAQDQPVQLPTIHTQAEQEQGLKVDQSSNSKFVVPLLDTPKSVSVISKQLIADTQVTSLSDALRTIPGITLGAGEGGNPNGDRPFIRGYNSESSMYVDGIRNSTSQNREMFAVEQVENAVFLQNFETEKNQKYAIVLGNEVFGVAQKAVEICDGTIEIPQLGTKHSLNISVSAGIVVWDLFKKLHFHL